MSFATINKCANDEAFKADQTRASRAKGSTPGSAFWAWWCARLRRRPTSKPRTRPSLADNPDPGGDESVITDEMILVGRTSELAGTVAVTDFGDYDPDDVWDATDTVMEQLRVIGQRVAWLFDHRDALTPWVWRIVADINFVRQRVIEGDV